MPSLFALVKHFFINCCVIVLFTIPFFVLTATWTEVWSAQQVTSTPQTSNSRAMVITDLQLQTNPLPNNLFAGEILNISLFMTKQNKKVSDDNFLPFISMSVIQKEPVKKRWFLHDNGLRDDKEAHDGIFNIRINKTLKAGKNQFTLQAKSEIFQREINHSVIVHEVDLIHTWVAQTQRENKNYHQIVIRPNLEFINAESIKISARLITDNGMGQTIKLSQADPKQSEWSFESAQLNPEKNYHIVVNMLTRAHNGRPINYTSAPIQLTLPKFDQDESLTIEELVTEKAEESHSAWFTGIIIAVIVNIILGIGSWTGYRKWQQNRNNAYEYLTGKLK